MRTFINIWEDRDWSTGKTSIHLKTKKGMEVFEYPWYFVIKEKDVTPKIRDHLRDCRDAGRIHKITKQKQWLKIYTDYYKQMEDNQVLMELIKTFDLPTYEADLSLWLRYLTDEDIELETDQSILYFDIETDDNSPFISPGADRITCIGAIGSDGKEYQFFSTKNEKKLLKKFIDLTKQYDIVTGWNSEGFDLVAIFKRAKELGLKPGGWVSSWAQAGSGGLSNVRKSGEFRARVQDFNHIDLMMKVKEMHYRDTELIKKVRSFSLENVSQHFLGEGKIDRGGHGRGSFSKMAREDTKNFKLYNMQDVRLLVKLDQKLHIIQQKIIEHAVCNARLNDYTSHGKIDPFALRSARKMGQHLPSRPFHLREEEEKVKEEKEDYAGGFVFEPVKGLHDDVYIFDFQSLYPSIMKTFNVSIDTYLGQNVKGAIRMVNGASFSKKRRGIISGIVQDALDQRNKIRFEIMKKVKKDSEEYWNWHYRQYSFKVLANSMYGIMGASFSRYFKRELAEGITLTGQALIKTMWKWFENRGHTPIYGDSDSLFVKFGWADTIEKLNADIKVFLDERLQKYNINENHMQMDFEKKYDKFILVAKKKYMGRAADGSLKVTGLEVKKRDTLPLAERLQNKVLDSLLTTDRKEDYYIEVIARLHHKVYGMKLDKAEITFQKKLSREISAYGTESKKTGRKSPIPIYVQVAAEMKRRIDDKKDKSIKKDYGLVSSGSYISWIVTDKGGKRVKVEGKEKKVKQGIKGIYSEFFDGHYDPDYYWEAIFAPTRRVLEVVFPETDWDKIGERKLL